MPKIEYRAKRLQSAALLLIEQSNVILEKYADMGYDMTLRQLYYQFVAADLFPDESPLEANSKYEQVGA